MTTSRSLYFGALCVLWGGAIGYLVGTRALSRLTLEVADTKALLDYQTTNTLPLVTLSAATAGWTMAGQGLNLTQLTNVIHEIAKAQRP